MTNEEMQNIIEFMIQRQETFAGNLDRLEANQERLQANQERLQTQVAGLATIVGEIGAAQIRTEEAVRQTQSDLSHLSKVAQQTQNDLSHLSKIVPLLVERNGGGGQQNQ